MNLVIVNRQRSKKINARALKKIVVAICDELEIADYDLGINLVDAREMSNVNGQFLQHEGSTDVITFDHGDRGGRRAEGGLKIHGELFICVDEAVSYAKQFKTTWQLEIIRYIIHGILHLLGHDDLKAGPRRQMKREENRLVKIISKKFPLTEI